VIRAGARLEPVARRITREPDGWRESAAGAAVGLYFLVEAASWEMALQLASRCPGAAPGTIDVFELDREASLPVASAADDAPA
jgi:hypothetical protein